MIEITDLKGAPRIINAEMIESVESNPDTQIVLNNGHRFYARETPDEILERVIVYRQRCARPLEIRQAEPGSGARGQE